MKYAPVLHTPESLRAQCDSLSSANPDMVLVGSLGRAVLFNEWLGDPTAEYVLRGEKSLVDRYGNARDLDVIGVTDTSVGDKPFTVDRFCFDNRDIQVQKQGDDWVLSCPQTGFAKTLHPDTVSPITGYTVDGIRVTTWPWQTHLALTSTRGTRRIKDDATFAFLEQVGSQRGTILPQELYRPFDSFAQHAASRIGLARRVYRRLPAGVSRYAQPLLHWLGLLG